MGAILPVNVSTLPSEPRGLTDRQISARRASANHTSGVRSAYTLSTSESQHFDTRRSYAIRNTRRTPSKLYRYYF